MAPGDGVSGVVDAEDVDVRDEVVFAALLAAAFAAEDGVDAVGEFVVPPDLGLFFCAGEDSVDGGYTVAEVSI